MKLWLTIMTCTVLAFVACDDEPEPFEDGLNHSDTDADNDSDTDSDADSDSDSDTDSDSDSDSDSDTDTTTSTDSLDCDGGRFDASTGLCWQHPASEDHTWQEALDYCNNLTLAGHSDWYLPSISDYFDLMENCSPEYFIAIPCDGCYESPKCTAMFGDEQPVLNWTSTPIASPQSYSASLWSGWVEGTYVTDDHNVRCVR